MAITDQSAYNLRRLAPWQRLNGGKSSRTTTAGGLYSGFIVAPNTGTAPTTAAAPTRATAGAFKRHGGENLQNSSGVQRIVGVRGCMGQPGRLILVDRLSHQGGLNGTVATPQSTNFPTAALTRYTTGEGVELGVEIYTQIGTTATTITATYTDQGGNTGQVTPTVPFGGTGNREAGRVVLLPLASGDTGVRAVADIDLGVSTGTVGAFGVTLFKRLLSIPVREVGTFEWDPLLDGGGNMPEILADACLHWMFLSYTTSTGPIDAVIMIAED